MFISTKFKTPTDFRKSLESRLQSQAIERGVDLQRLRRKVAFDRFLARIFSQEKPGFYLKGGYAMELRLAHARATKDIDLTCVLRAKNEEELLSELILNDLRNFARYDLNDYFVYQIGEPQMDLENAPYGGFRYPILSLVDKRIFVRFQLDVGADYLLDEVEAIQGTNWLGFCGISAPVVPMISIEQQFAEKLHAYTVPRRERTNSRVKDLVDMILLLNIRTPKSEEIFQIMHKVFEKRATHPLPQKLERPPPEWQLQFHAMMSECGLLLDMKDSFLKISNFYDSLISVHFSGN